LQQKGKIILYYPIRGKDLYGVSFQSDMNTVYGVSFGHKSETPGLGARLKRKISTAVGKQIFDESGQFVSVTPLREVQNQMICMVLMLFREQQ
jgi:Na+-transporting NADH:ubiquinone oxidoreductase subunit C